MAIPGEAVLDASALLAHLLDEPGGEVVTKQIGTGAVISAVNLTEALVRVTDRGADPVQTASEWDQSGLIHSSILIEEFTYDDSVEAARLRPLTRHLGLSLADRACLALARRLDFPVLTADQAWSDLDLGVEIRVIR